MKPTKTQMALIHEGVRPGLFIFGSGGGHVIADPRTIRSLIAQGLAFQRSSSLDERCKAYLTREAFELDKAIRAVLSSAAARPDAEAGAKVEHKADCAYWCTWANFASSGQCSHPTGHPCTCGAAHPNAVPEADPSGRATALRERVAKMSDAEAASLWGRIQAVGANAPSPPPADAIGEGSRGKAWAEAGGRKQRFRCPDCGFAVAADEDGCCAACGRDCEHWELVYQPPPDDGPAPSPEPPKPDASAPRPMTDAERGERMDRVYQKSLEGKTITLDELVSRRAATPKPGPAETIGRVADSLTIDPAAEALVDRMVAKATTVATTKRRLEPKPEPQGAKWWGIWCERDGAPGFWRQTSTGDRAPQAVVVIVVAIAAAAWLMHGCNGSFTLEPAAPTRETTMRVVLLRRRRGRGIRLVTNADGSPAPDDRRRIPGAARPDPAVARRTASELRKETKPRGAPSAGAARGPNDEE